VTGLTDRQIQEQIRRNDDFLENTFGFSGRPYFRPPYGHHDARTDRVTSDLGYPHTVMWFGTLGDSSLLSPAQILANAQEWFRPRHIVIGHANHPAVTYVFGQFAELIRSRSLQTVTLNDVFSPLA
jgi:peptidoglycan/xylan/chitin deacetylase (PgdA/CDA1 family)